MTIGIWVFLIFLFLLLQIVLIYIVIHKSYRYKHTIDPIDERTKDMNRERAEEKNT
ncbi:YtzI protein [Sporosarcina sp. FSL K6-2383]|uniref:YtzI protein n=1 Tax=Sporosarcina sp. FSL K6-2383 TaxID=2921556 RepID=UPI00315AEF5A